MAWVALQGVTQEWQEKGWFKYLQEIDVNDAPTVDASKARFRRLSCPTRDPNSRVLTVATGTLVFA